MNENALPAYRHSGKFTPWGLLLTLGVAAVVAFPLGLLYAALVRWVPFILINVFLTMGYGIAFGALTTRLLKLGRVRNSPVAALCGVAVGLIALYFEWSGHLHMLVDDAPWLFTPAEILRGMQYLYAEGSWTFKGDTVTGIMLALVWIVEAGIILAFAAHPPYDRIANTPFSEADGCWLDEQKTIDSLEAITDPAQLATLEAGDIMPVIQASPRPTNAADYTRLTLKRSPRCTSFCTLRVQNVSTSINTEGKVTEKTTNLTRDLILDSSMFEVIAQLEQVPPEPEPSDPSEPPLSTTP